MRPGRRPLSALGFFAAAVALAACGSGLDEDQHQRRPGDGTSAAASIRHLPKPLAENRAAANQIIEGSTEALDAKLAELKGHPVVVNQWGSWCPPCRAEFPFFAEAADAHARKVAFLGIDVQDHQDAAEDFLEESPVPYPSIYDPEGEAAGSLGWTQVSPSTWFIDERSEVVHQRPGAYPDRDALEADIQRFLLDA